jgi:hypothetical protein
MSIRVYPFKASTVTWFVRQLEVAAQTEFAAPVDVQTDRILGMLQNRAMTVFATYVKMRRIFYVVVIILMALLAGFGAPVFDLYSFPLGLIALPVETVHVTLFMDTEIVRHQKHSRHQNQCDNA